jgi:hypothetical protein
LAARVKLPTLGEAGKSVGYRMDILHRDAMMYLFVLFTPLHGRNCGGFLAVWLFSACPYFGDENDYAPNGYEPCANGY